VSITQTDFASLSVALDKMTDVENRLDMLERHLAGLCRADCRCKTR